MELCLGTVQLGMSYGIAGGSQFDEKSSIKLLKEANKLGINMFDTASAYGKAECILGKFVEMQNGTGLKIVSKCSNDNNFKESLKGSLKSLNITFLDGYLFHNAESIYDKQSFSNMISCKEEGYVKNIGVSIYNPEDALYAAKQKWIDYIQIPYNVFDHRLEKLDFFNIAKENSKTIFARSILLQGLLIMSPDRVPEKLNFTYDYLRKYSKIVEKYDSTPLELAVQYVKSNQLIDYIVFGVYGIDQLMEFVEKFNNGNIKEDSIEEIKSTFSEVEDRVVSPNLW